MSSSRRYDLTKRLLDGTLAIGLLVLLSPVMLAVGVLVVATMGGPVLYRQPRPGRHGTVFMMVKFRSMRPADPALGLVNDQDRLTRTGRLLRSTSLDELPNLWNVLSGHMSMVGPRPLLPDYLDRYTPEQTRRHEVRPGITGLAQVRGRNGLRWEERLAYDVWYVDHRCLALDLRILTQTGWAVLRRQGITAPGSATSPAFEGTPAATAATLNEPAA